MGHCVKDMTCTKVVMVGLKGSPLCRFQDKGHQLQVHREYLQDHRKPIQSISQHRPALILHLNLLQAHLGDPWLASQSNNSSCQQNHRKQMLQALQNCSHCRKCPLTIMMQVVSATIRQTWALPKANHYSAWGKPNSTWGNLPKGWGRPTIVCSTSGRKLGSWVYRERPSVDNSGAEPIETGSWWTPTQGIGCGKSFGDIRDLAAIGSFR